MMDDARCCDEFDELRRRQARWEQSRRDFLKTAVGAMAAAPFAPHLLLKSALAQNVTASDPNAPILVVINLQGGNDGLNTVVPYGSGLYYQGRPTIGVPQASVLRLDDMVGLNPNLATVKPLYDAGKMAIVQGVGYPNPDRSHFRSTTIWATADPVGLTPTGWLGRYMDTALADVDNPLKAVSLGPVVPEALGAELSPATALETLDTFKFLVGLKEAQPILDAYRTMYGGSLKDVPPYISLVKKVEGGADQSVQDLATVKTAYSSKVTYPPTRLGRDLQLVAQLIASNLGTRIFHVTVGGFDDHAAEVLTHANLLKQLADAVAVFYQDLAGLQKDSRVMTMTYSEFGRRVKENGGRGTDHGTAAPMFIFGGGVKGGLYGQDPILSNLDPNGDLVYGVDFRSVYSTILDNWMAGDAKTILGGTFDHVGFV